MIIDARRANNADSNYQQFTVRQALDAAIRATLHKPGDMLHIEQAHDVHGDLIDSRKLQIVIRQVIPDGWELTTKRVGDHGVKIWRLV